MTTRHSIFRGMLSATLFAAIAIPSTLLAIVAPEVFNEKAEKSKVKAVAVVVDVKSIGETDGIEKRFVTFKLEKKVSEDAIPEEFIGSCQSVVKGKPKLGEALYFNPLKGQRYYVTVSEKENEITSLTPMTPRLMNALVKTPDKVKFKIGLAVVDDGADQYVEKADEALKKKDYRQAASDISKAIQICNTYDAAFNLRGKILLETESYASAEEDFSKAIMLNPGLLDAYFQRGICKTNQGRYSAAIEDFSKVVEVDPGDLQALYCRASAYKYSGDLDKALADYRSIEQSDKDNHIVSRQIAFIDYEKGDFASAEKQFARTLEIVPSDLYAAIFLHISQSKQKKPSSIVQNFEKLKSINEWPSSALKMFAGQLSPEKCVEAAYSTKPGEQWRISGAYFYAGEKLLIDGDKDNAAIYFKKCLDTKDTKSLEYFYAKREFEALKQKAQ